MAVWDRVRGWTSPLVRELAGLTPNQKFLVGTAVAVGLAGILLMAERLAAPPPYVPVFTNLAPQDAAAITQYLSQAKIPYQLSPDGTTVSVPAPDAGQARIGVASQGLPKQGVVGFELFDQPQLGATDFQQQVMYQQALEGQLDRTIMQMQQVQLARVELVLPKRSVFVSESQPASAAVFLQLKPFASLTPAEVQGIMYLVARSVPGLSPQNVTVVDSQGHILTPAPQNASQASLTSNMKAQQAFQANLAQGLTQLLEPVFGPGNVAVQVHADLNFNRTQVEQQLYSAPVKGGLLRTLNRLSVTFQGQGTPPAPAGTSSNIPTYLQGLATGPSRYTRTQSEATYAINKTTVRTVVAPGSVRRLTVAVVVNRRLTPAQARLVRATVAAAVGYDPARRDFIQVSGLPFSTSLSQAVLAQMRAEQQAQRLAMLLPAGIAAAGVLAVLLLLLAWRRRQVAQAVTPEGLTAAVPVAPPEAPREPTPEELRQEELRRLVMEHPEQAAQIIRVWLSQD